MKKVTYLFVLVALWATMAQAEMIAFEAEDPDVYIQAGDVWQDVDNENASGGQCMTGTSNSPLQNEQGIRRYEFDVPAGTYDLYVRYTMSSVGGTWQNDSFLLSDSTFASQSLPGGTWETHDNLPETGIDGVSTVDDSFGWVLVDTDFVMSPSGTGYLCAYPAEDGMFIDAFAYVTQGQAVTNAELNEILNPTNMPVLIYPLEEDQYVLKSEVRLEWAAPGKFEPNSYNIYLDPSLSEVELGSASTALEVKVIGDPDPNYPSDDPTDYIALAHSGTIYYWRVEAKEVLLPDPCTGIAPDPCYFTSDIASFRTRADDETPLVTADNVLTSVEFLPTTLTGTVEDFDEDDLESVAWEVVGINVPAAAKQMILRDTEDDIANLAEIADDPNLLMDWIGTDTRQRGDPLILLLKSLPAGTYDWKSYHHDVRDQTNLFDVRLIDDNGTSLFTDIDISDANNVPISTFETTIEANGTDDVIIAFNLQRGDPDVIAELFFVMNGFELTGPGDPLKIDFGQTVDPNVAMPGYQLYEADHEVAESFTEQSYSAFGTTVSILPVWGAPGLDAVTVTDTTVDPNFPTATIDTVWSTEYEVRLSVTDSAQQTGSVIMTVTVAEDTCDAAQLSTSWPGFNVADFTKDCIVNLKDFPSFATEWLDNRNLTAQESQE